MHSDISFDSFSETPITSKGYPTGSRLLEYRSTVDGKDDWAVLCPPRDTAVTTWIISIHGHGAHGRQLFIRADVRKLWLPDFLATGFGFCTPNLRGNAWMGPDAVADMDALIDHLRSQYHATRFIFYAGSMGGTSSMIYATLRPQNVQALALLGATCDMPAYYRFCRNNMGTTPILEEIADAITAAYGGGPDEQADLYAAHSPIWNYASLEKIPFYLSHGEVDDLMPVEQSRRLALALKDAPFFIYHEIAGCGHDAPLAYGQAASQDCSFNILDWINSHLDSDR